MGVLRKLFGEQRERLVESGQVQQLPRVSASLIAKVAPMAARGLLLKARLRASNGVPLVGRNVAIRNAQFVSVGRDCVIEDGAELQGLAREGIHLGDAVSIGAQSMIRPSSYYSRSIGIGLHVGNNSSIGPQCYIGCSGGITIGNNVMLAPGVRMFSENHNFSESVTIKEQGVAWNPIVIEDDCWIASGATILAGVTIGKGSVVAAGAVVTKSFGPNSVVAGVPAKMIGGR